jgi:hypothetical protein
MAYNNTHASMLSSTPPPVAALQVATKEKNAAEERMAIVQARLDEMQAQFDAAMAQKQMLEDDAAACQKKMDSAAALLHALAGEGCILCAVSVCRITVHWALSWFCCLCLPNVLVVATIGPDVYQLRAALCTCHGCACT